ncbi:transporter [Paraburkholderia sp.]|uniref:transporter n=1 Tax=Paraburkholderia sp. TaxID=1926495 RepID=UPI0025D19D99|nr:transporter [Paraburkholderia sp.]
MRTLFARYVAPARAALLISGALACMAGSPAAYAHAVVGDRVFPATMAVDDPGVGDEFNMQFNHIKTPDSNGDDMNVNTVSYEWDKLITKNLAVSIAGNYSSQNSPDGSAKGWDDLTLGAKYLAYANARHEFMASVGLLATVGGTGSKAIGASYSTFTPTVYLGKGFGDLPASLGYLRPLAVTGTIGPNITTASSDNGPNSVGWGVTVQYSIPYLQNQVKDLGLPQPFANLVPVVEFPMSTCTAGDCAGQTTGTINPGLIWLNRYGQFGIEAQIPVNRATGTHVGVLVQAHLYFDDMFPNSLGKPLF